MTHADEMIDICSVKYSNTSPCHVSQYYKYAEQYAEYFKYLLHHQMK